MLYLYIVIAAVAVVALVGLRWYNRLGQEVLYFYTKAPHALRMQYLKNGWKKPETIPQVVIDKEGGYKYVALSYAGRIYIRAEKSKAYHDGIVRAFMFEVGSREVTCLGGGRIDVQPNYKRVYLHGTSQGYGMDRDRERSQRLIEEATGYDAGSKKETTATPAATATAA